MKITFIRPNIGRLAHGPYVDEGRMEPLTLGVIAAYTPPGDNCVLYDDRMEEIPFDEPTDLVAISVEIMDPLSLTFEGEKESVKSYVADITRIME